jgi:hypothetical protein
MLENACMKDEPLPEPIRGPGMVQGIGSATMGGDGRGSLGGQGLLVRVGRIEEEGDRMEH